MLFTRECDYAVRIIRALSAGELVNITRIIQEEHLPRAIAYKVARKLEQAGLITSVRGSTGGYRLRCDLKHTTLYDLFSAMDPGALLSDCMGQGYICSRNSQDAPCQIHRELCRIQTCLNQELQSRSLEELFFR